jgi:hypothetical protein
LPITESGRSQTPSSTPKNEVVDAALHASITQRFAPLLNNEVISIRGTRWLRWSPRRGSGASDVDALGAVVVGGYTGAAFGDLESGGLLAKYDTDGELQWQRNSEIGNVVYDLAIAPHGDMFVVEAAGMGWPPIMFLTKYTADGNFLWSHELGSYDDMQVIGSSLLTDSEGNAYLFGSTRLDLVPPFKVIRTLSCRKSMAWVRQFGHFNWEAPEPIRFTERRSQLGGLSLSARPMEIWPRRIPWDRMMRGLHCCEHRLWATPTATASSTSRTSTTSATTSAAQALETRTPMALLISKT